MKKIALITGAPGQDAAHLSYFLLKKDYRVIATYRYSSTPFDIRFKNYPIQDPNFSAICCDIIDPSACLELVQAYRPHEIYNLAAASHVGESFKNPISVFDINTKAVVNWLEVIRKNDPSIRFIQASTSEMFGSNFSLPYSTGCSVNVAGSPYQDENTPFDGNSPYAISKIAAHNMVKLYRKSYNLFCCSSICFNHESCFRGENFVTRKITKWLGDFYNWIFRQHLYDFQTNKLHYDKLTFDKNQIIHNDQTMGKKTTYPKLRLGNIKAIRDWSHAADFVKGMWMMLQADYADDYVLASGEGHSVEDFLRIAFQCVGIIDYEKYYLVDPKFFRACEVEFLRGDSNKIREKLHWFPRYSFKELVEEMVEYDKNAGDSRYP